MFLAYKDRQKHANRQIYAPLSARADVCTWNFENNIAGRWQRHEKYLPLHQTGSTSAISNKNNCVRFALPLHPYYVSHSFKNIGILHPLGIASDRLHASIKDPTTTGSLHNRRAPTHHSCEESRAERFVLALCHARHDRNRASDAG